MVLFPIVVASAALQVWINDVPDWQKGEALAQMQFEVWYLQPFYPHEEIALPSELVKNREADVGERHGSRRPAAAVAMAFPPR